MENLILSSFESKMRRLSPGIKTVLVAPETGDTIAAVCQKHNVSNRVFSYSGLVGLVLMGELNPNLLVKSIVEKENIDTEKAKLIALDISAAIFQQIKQELITMYGLTPKPLAPNVVPPTPQKPPEHIEWKAPPSTREAGISLPEIPNSTPLSVQEPSPSAPNPPTSGDQIFYSPPPSTGSGQAKPNVIDLSKEPPRPVAQPGDPPLEGNIVNLKDINSKPTF